MYAKHLMFMGGVLMFGIGVSQCDTNQCDETIYASDLPRWLKQFDGDITYDDGVWYTNSIAIGVSPTENTDVCVL